jgi:hypothetical protein
MPQLYAFQPDGHGPSSFFVMAESIDDALIRIAQYITKNEIDNYYWRGVNDPYKPSGLTAGTYINDSYILTILNPGEVIDNDNS